MGAVVFLAAPSNAQTSAPAATATPANATQVLDHIQAYWKNLQSYQVPVTMQGSVKVSFISVPFSMDGTEYFRAPNQTKLKMNNVPSLAKGFEDTMANMGTPETWPKVYDIVLKGTATRKGHLDYVLYGVPRKPANVKNVTMWVNARTYAIVSVAINYNNGASLELDLNHRGDSPYHLPTSIGVQANFPQYKGSATITYGKYQTNVPIPDSAFEPSR